ncbi:MAG: S8 family serine peptidase [Planctomycetota bacterium]
MRRRWAILILLLALAPAGCRPREGSAGSPVEVFVLDTPINMNFVEGRGAALPESEITHGSLVGRVVRRYTRAEIVGVTVEGLTGAVDREAYLRALRRVLKHVQESPERRVVVNVSLASPRSNSGEEELVRRLARAGALVVAAAGNEDSAEPMYPAAYEDAVAVANATPEGKALSSNYGPHVDIAASGDITFIDYEFLPYERLRREMEARGTSFAAPRVAGTVAWLLSRRPELTPRRAYRLIASTARPIESDHYRRGRLGVGLLKVDRTKSALSSGFRFTHFFLPIAVWVALGGLTACLCLEHGLPGLFVSLMVWLVALPTSVLLVVRSYRYLEFVGEGSVTVGAAAAGVLGLGALATLWLLRWNVVRAVIVLAAPYSLFSALPAFEAAAGMPPLLGAALAACVALSAAVAWEVHTVRRLVALGDCPAPESKWQSAEDLLHTYRWSLDGRIKRAVLAALGRMDGPGAAEFLLRERRFPAAATGALAELAGENPEVLTEWLSRFDELKPQVRDRLDEALLDCQSGRAEALVERLAHAHSSPGLEKLLNAMRYGEAGSEEEPPPAA